MRRLRAFALGLSLLLPAPVLGQDATTLVADRVEIQADSVLVATGAVEVLNRGVRLTASRIAYDATGETLTIDGPITITDDSGTVVLADAAELSSDLRDGLLQSARLVLDQQLQMASSEMLRVGGRYTQLGRTVASSCSVCAENPVPLWEIRARRVVHDEAERQIYFDHAQLRVAGVPVFYLPRLRMPDPTLERATGFLQPSIRTTSQLGFGVKVPYFIRMGDSRDLTLEPYASTQNMWTVGARYRQAFRTGQIEFNGAVTQDQIMPGETRGYFAGVGSFDVPLGFILSFDVLTASDNSYLLEYGITTQDRLDSDIMLERVRSEEYINAVITNYRSVREGDDNSILPSTVGEVNWYRRFVPGMIGGIAEFRLEGRGNSRRSSSEIDSNNDGTSDGRDVSRTGVSLDWRRDWVLPGGLVGTALAAGIGDVTFVGEDQTYNGTIERTFGLIGGELSWPMLRTGASGATQVLEPVVQLVWAPDSSADVPNEDSLLVEFDEGNLFSLNRFPGSDAVEHGPRATLGVNWTRYDPTGWTLGASLGRAVRLDDNGQFDAASGLDGTTSDWLAGVRYTNANGLSLIGRTLVDDSLSATRSEARVTWYGETFGLSSGYIWGESDLSSDWADSISELTIDGSFQVADNWAGTANVVHDFIVDRASSAGVGMEYRNECMLVDLYLSRRYTSSTSVEPTTEFTFAVDLLGFGGSAAPGPARRCRQ